MDKYQNQTQTINIKNLRIGTWNVRTLQTGAFGELIKIATTYHIDLIALQETRWPNEGILSKNNYAMFYGGGKGGALGTGFLINKRILQAVTDVQFVNDRLSYIVLKNSTYKQAIINVHCPTETTDKNEIDNIKDLYYETVEQVYDRFSSYDAKIVLGDFNAKIGKESIFRPTIGTESLHDFSNDNGTRLISFATSKNLLIKSTYFKHRNIHKMTWKHPDGHTYNQIDHVLIDKRHHTNILDIRSYRGADVHSDHFLVVAKLRFRLAINKNTNVVAPRVRFDIEKLKNDVRQVTGYQLAISNRFKALQEEGDSNNNNDDEADPDTLWHNIQNTIKAAAKTTIGLKRQSKSKPWFDEECELWFEERSKARIINLQNKCAETHRKYIEICKNTSRFYRRKKREWEKNKILAIENHKKQNNTREMYRGINSIRKGFQSRTDVIRDKNGNLVADATEGLNLWKNYFDKLLNVREDPAENNNYDDIHTAELQVDEPSDEEIVTAIRKLKNNKAAGIDDLPSELIKYGGPSLTKQISKLIRVIWETERIPEEWNTSIIVPIFKKGDKTDCNNYRGISIVPSCYKILSNIIVNRLTPYAEEIIGDYQCGFRRNRSTSDHMFTIRQLLEKKWEHVEALHQLFIDFKKAYDSIIRARMYWILVFLGIPKKLVRLIEVCLRGSKGKVRANGNLSEEFSIHDGLKQGDALSCILFNLVLEYVVRQVQTEPTGATLNGILQILGYADDLDILGDDKETVTKNAEILITKAKEIGLEISESKTKYMILDRAGVSDEEVDLAVGNKKFERVDEFKYLGTIITSDNDFKTEINKRLQTGNGCYFATMPLLKSRSLSRRIKIRVYKTIIMPVVLYGCETWALTQTQENRFRVFENKVLRKIYGPKRDEETGEWRKLHNDELHALYGSPNILRVMKARKLRWAGHVARMGNDRSVAQIMKGKPNSKRPLGRPRIRWRDNLKKDLAELGYDYNEWVDEAQDRDAWRSRVDEAMNFRVPNAAK